MVLIVANFETCNLGQVMLRRQSDVCKLAMLFLVNGMGQREVRFMVPEGEMIVCLEK